MSKALFKDGKPAGDQEEAALKAIYAVFKDVFHNESSPSWNKFQVNMDASDGLKQLLKVSNNAEDGSPSDVHEKFLRAILHVLAGMFAASAVLLAASITALPSSGASNPLYTRVISEVMMLLALVLFLGAFASLLIQLLRFFNKRDGWPSGWPCSVAAVVCAVLLVFLPSYLATETAVCGAAALAVNGPARALEVEGETATAVTGTEIAAGVHLVGWLPGLCGDEARAWFPPPDS